MCVCSELRRWTEALDYDAAHLYLFLQCMSRVDQLLWLVLVWIYLPLNAFAAAKRNASWLVAMMMNLSAHIAVIRHSVISRFGIGSSRSS